MRREKGRRPLSREGREGWGEGLGALKDPGSFSPAPFAFPVASARRRSSARAAFVQRSIDAWVIWDPYLAAIQRQANARVLTDGEGIVRNTQYYVSSRKFADAQPQVLHTLLDELNQVDQWGRNNISAVAAQLSPLVGLDAATLELALGRAAYGVQPITDATLAYQQQIADTFTDLKLIPKKLTVADARWNSVG